MFTWKSFVFRYNDISLLLRGISVTKIQLLKSHSKFVFSFFTPQEAHEEHDTSTENADDSNHDPQFEPIVSLPEQEIKTLEEDEEELFKM